MENEKYQIPKYLDEPFKIIFFTLDEFLVLLVPFLIGLWVFDSPIFGLIVGASGIFILRKIKGERGHNYLYHLMYWYLPPLRKFRRTPPSYMRDFLG